MKQLFNTERIPSYCHSVETTTMQTQSRNFKHSRCLILNYSLPPLGTDYYLFWIQWKLNVVIWMRNEPFKFRQLTKFSNPHLLVVLWECQKMCSSCRYLEFRFFLSVQGLLLKMWLKKKNPVPSPMALPFFHDSSCHKGLLSFQFPKLN